MTMSDNAANELFNQITDELNCKSKNDDNVVAGLLAAAGSRLRQCERARRNPNDVLSISYQLLRAVQDLADAIKDADVFFTTEEGYIHAADTKHLLTILRTALEEPVACLQDTLDDEIWHIP
jgi:outer membrane PBP1 activator LpoA protein